MAAAWLGSPVCAAQQFGVGIHNNYIQTAQAEQSVDSLFASGDFSFRTDYRWQSVEENEPGKLAVPKVYEELEALVASSAARGQSPVLVLDYGNKYYDNGGFPVSPAAILAYTNYVRFVVGHFKGRVTQFEVWNEWSNGHGTVPAATTGSAASYVALLRATYAAIKAANPDAVVIGGAVAGLDDNWIDQFVQAGGLGYLDALSVHPYVQSRTHRPNAPKITTPSTEPITPRNSAAAVLGTPEDAIAWIDLLKTRLDSFSPGKSVPIYVTEIGWSTNRGGYGLTEIAAAAYLQRFMLLARTRAWIRGVWWYDLIDDGSNGAVAENRFGLLRTDGSSKPALASYLQIADFLQSSYSAVQSSGPNGEIIVVGQDTKGKQFLAKWQPTNNFSVTSGDSAANVVGPVPQLPTQ